MKLVIFYVEWLSFLRIKIEIGIEMLVFVSIYIVIIGFVVFIASVFFVVGFFG